jgi:hypothetical protein
VTVTDIDRVQVFAISVSVVLLLSVLELVRRRKLVEEYAFLWIAGSVVMLVLSIWREILHAVASELGVFYPPSALLLLLGILVFVALLWFSVVLSRQRRQIERLIEETAILGAEVRDLRVEHASSQRAAPKRPEA